MSRNGRIPIDIPENTQVRVDNGIIFAKGKLENSLSTLIVTLKSK